MIFHQHISRHTSLSLFTGVFPVNTECETESMLHLKAAAWPGQLAERIEDFKVCLVGLQRDCISSLWEGFWYLTGIPFWEGETDKMS